MFQPVPKPTLPRAECQLAFGALHSERARFTKEAGAMGVSVGRYIRFKLGLPALLEKAKSEFNNRSK